MRLTIHRRPTLSERIRDIKRASEKKDWVIAELAQENEQLRGQLSELRASIERGAVRVG